MGCCGSTPALLKKVTSRSEPRTTQVVPIKREHTDTNTGNLYDSLKLVPIEEVESKLRRSCKQRELVRKFLRADVIDLKLSPTEVKDLTVLFKNNSHDGIMDFSEFRKLVGVDSSIGGDGDSATEISQRDLLQRQLYEGLAGGAEEGDDALENSGIVLTDFLKGFSFWKEHLASATDAFVFFFRMFDTDQSGDIGQTEFRKMVRHVLISQAYDNAKDEDDNSDQTPTAVPVTGGVARGSRFGATPTSPSTARRMLVTDFATLVYRDFDRDGSGEIDFNEFSTWVRSNPGAVSSLGSSEEALLETFQRQVFASALHVASIPTLFAKYFELDVDLRFDDNGDLSLDKREFSNMLRHTHVLNQCLPRDIEDRLDEFCSSVFKAIDTDGSGEIELAEFKRWITRNPKDGEKLFKKGASDAMRRTSNSDAAHLHNAFIVAPGFSKRGMAANLVPQIQRSASHQTLVKDLSRRHSAMMRDLVPSLQRRASKSRLTIENKTSDERKADGLRIGSEVGGSS